MTIEDAIAGPLAQYKSTLKECSLDSAKNEYLTESGLSAYNFDKIVKEYCSINHLNCFFCSNDVLILNKDKVLFIEFKKVNCNKKLHNLLKIN